ncbi:MAG: endonuclease domain-containing protein [Armatimonadota bacterium]
MRRLSNYTSLPYNPALKERARELRKAGNLCEVLLWQQFHKRKFRGYDFDRQKIIGSYIVDFFCVDCRVVIEIDGNYHNGKVEYDQERDRYLESLELTVIHIPASDILIKLDSVMLMLHSHPALAIPVSRTE